MLFSEIVFLLCFLPFVVCIYYLLKFLFPNVAVRNVFLLLASMIFYAYGNTEHLLIVFGSVVFNYIFGIMIEKFQKVRKIILAVAVIANIGILFYYKYLFFVLSNFNRIFNGEWEIANVALPLGISFFTFQAMSYVIDIYRNKVKAQKNLLYLGLYIMLFPQLVAGPIVRYETVEKQIKCRVENMNLFSDGITRFMLGLGKKVIVSNNLAIVADYVFGCNYSETSVVTLWIGALAYTLQIYFDFSGYSDMAIGLGKIFGFEFEENFNYPYVAKSVTDFWRRWHISLSTWFRDYVYIPLGGNRCSKYRNIFNLFVVWVVTGIWHGANWTFVFWGLGYFLLLFVEKYIIHPEMFKNVLVRMLYRGFTFLCIELMWILFRADNLMSTLSYYRSMFGGNSIGLYDTVSMVILKEYGIFFIIAMIGAVPFDKKIKILQKNTWDVVLIKTIWTSLILIVSLVLIVNNSYNPFIYFNF